MKLDHIGDFVLAMRPMQELRKAWPNAKITLVCGPWNTGLAAKMKIFDRIVGFAFFPEIARDFASKADDKYNIFSQELDLGSFDLAIDLRYEQDTRPLLDRVTASFRAGYYAKNLRCPLDIELPRAEHYSKRARRPPPLHTETRLALLINAVITTFHRREMHPLQVFRDDSQIPLGLPDHRFIVIAPTAGKTTCQWPLSNFVSLCEHIIVGTDVNLVLVGHKHDIEGTRESYRRILVTDGVRRQRFELAI